MKEILIGFLLVATFLTAIYLLGHISRIVKNTFSSWHTPPEDFEDTMSRGFNGLFILFVIVACLAFLFFIGEAFKIIFL